MHRKAFWLLLLVVFAINGALHAQVSFSARVFYPNGKPVYDKEYDFIYKEGFCHYYLKVDGEDTLRSCCPADTIRFENIPVGVFCQLFYNDLLVYFQSDFFTLASDEFVDVTVRKISYPYSPYYSFFFSKAEKDSVFIENVAQWSLNANGYDTIWCEDDSLDEREPNSQNYWIDREPNSLKLARLYYSDWINPISSWHTFQHSADSAYKYCQLAYKKYDYLYYPLRQLAYFLGEEPKLRQPSEPNSRTYVKRPTMPDEWWKDTKHDLFLLWEDYEHESRYLGGILKGAKEVSLCYPTVPEGVVRFVESAPLGANIVWRLQDGKMYCKDLSVYNYKIRQREIFDLTPAEIDSLTILIEEFHKLGRPDIEKSYIEKEIDGADFWLEYVVDGQYKCYSTCAGSYHPLFSKIIDKFWQVYKAHHVKPKNRKTDY